MINIGIDLTPHFERLVETLRAITPDGKLQLWTSAIGFGVVPFIVINLCALRYMGVAPFLGYEHQAAMTVLSSELSLGTPPEQKAGIVLRIDSTEDVVTVPFPLQDLERVSSSLSADHYQRHLAHKDIEAEADSFRIAGQALNENDPITFVMKGTAADQIRIGEQNIALNDLRQARRRSAWLALVSLAVIVFGFGLAISLGWERTELRP